MSFLAAVASSRDSDGAEWNSTIHRQNNPTFSPQSDTKIFYLTNITAYGKPEKMFQSL